MVNSEAQRVLSQIRGIAASLTCTADYEQLSGPNLHGIGNAILDACQELQTYIDQHTTPK